MHFPLSVSLSLSDKQLERSCKTASGDGQTHIDLEQGGRVESDAVKLSASGRTIDIGEKRQRPALLAVSTVGIFSLFFFFFFFFFFFLGGGGGFLGLIQCISSIQSPFFWDILISF